MDELKWKYCYEIKEGVMVYLAVIVEPNNSKNWLVTKSILHSVFNSRTQSQNYNNCHYNMMNDSDHTVKCVI